MHSRIGRSRGFGGTHIQRFRAGQRVNIPRSIWGSGRPMVRNTTIYLGGYSGGNHCCCGGGGSKFLNWMTGITAFMGVFSGFFGSFFGSRQTPAEDPNTSYAAGYQAGLGTLTGNASAAQGADSSSRTQAQKELDAMNNNKKYSYTNGKIPSVTDDGKYKYGDKTYDTISDLETAIEEDQQPADPATKDDETVKKTDGQGGPDPDNSTDWMENVYKNSSDLATSYNNLCNSYSGRSYNSNGLTINENHVAQIDTFSAFVLSSNKYSSITISSQNNNSATWNTAFSQIQKDNNENMKEDDFINFFKAYEKNAEEDAKIENHDQASQRRKTATVKMSNEDETYLKQLFSIIAGDNKILSKNEFSKFMTELFNSSYATKDNNNTTIKLTRVGLDNFVKEYITKNKNAQS